MAKTIFLVDDSATILLSVSSILGKAGFAVEKASNADEALKKFKAGVKVDLLITDLNMPGMNGIELIKQVRTLPAYKFLPILFLTTESQQSRKAEAKAAGASGWIVKPATADDLRNTIKLFSRSAESMTPPLGKPPDQNRRPSRHSAGRDRAQGDSRRGGPSRGRCGAPS